MTIFRGVRRRPELSPIGFLLMTMGFWAVAASPINAQTLLLRVQATSVDAIRNPAAGPPAIFLTRESPTIDPANGLANLGGTWRSGIVYAPVAVTGTELIAEVDYTPYGIGGGHLITLVDPTGLVETRLEVVRRERLALSCGSQRRQTVVIHWPRDGNGPRTRQTIRLIRAGRIVRLEFNGATWLTFDSNHALAKGNYQVKVGWLSASDPSAPGYYSGWRVIQRTSPSPVLPGPDWGLPASMAGELQALEARVSALCVPDRPARSGLPTTRRLRSAAARVALDSLWARAYATTTGNFDQLVSNLNTDVLDPLQYGTDNDCPQTLSVTWRTDHRWLLGDNGLYFGMLGWDLCPYIKDLSDLGYNCFATSIVPDYVYHTDGSKSMEYVEGVLAANLDMAARYGMKVDVLLSPMTPTFLLAAHPEWQKGNPNQTCGHGFIQACILSPEYRDMCREYVSLVVNRLKGHPALGAYDLGNEVQFMEYCARAQSLFRDYLGSKYTSIGALNRAWGSSYSAWSNITMTRTMGTDATNKPRYWDWVDFNTRIGSDFISFLNGLVKSIDPATPVHVKTLPHEFGLPGEDGRAEYDYPDGVDRRALANLNDIVGTDSWADAVDGEGDLATNVIRQIMYYDLISGYAPGKPLYDSEWHIVNTTKWTSPSYLNALMTLGVVHNLRAGNLWVASPDIESMDVISQGGLLYQSGRTSYALRRLFPSIRALAQRPKPIALLYSRVSKYLDGDNHYLHTKRLYEIGQYTGLGVTLLEERDLLAGNLRGAKAIWAVDCPHAMPGVAAALANFAQTGGKVWGFGFVAIWNPDGTVQSPFLPTFPSSNLRFLPYTDDAATLYGYYQTLAGSGTGNLNILPLPVVLRKADGSAPLGVAWDYIVLPDGSVTVFAANIGRSSVDLQWDTSLGSLYDLTNEVNTGTSLSLPSLGTFLGRLRP